nr:MAG TPA: hypothetical protein [Caudoviricetes sp.]DAX85195.1 MAG TPA: hypothetical protein [Caudoviricetes sp.]
MCLTIRYARTRIRIRSFEIRIDNKNPIFLEVRTLKRKSELFT